MEVEGYAPCAIGTLEGEEESLPMLVRGEQRGSLTIYGAEERSGPALLASLTVVADAVSRLELQAALEASEG